MLTRIFFHLNTEKSIHSHASESEKQHVNTTQKHKIKRGFTHDISLKVPSTTETKMTTKASTTTRRGQRSFRGYVQPSGASRSFGAWRRLASFRNSVSVLNARSEGSHGGWGESFAVVSRKIRKTATPRDRRRGLENSAVFGFFRRLSGRTPCSIFRLCQKGNLFLDFVNFQGFPEFCLCINVLFAIEKSRLDLNNIFMKLIVYILMAFNIKITNL